MPQLIIKTTVQIESENINSQATEINSVMSSIYKANSDLVWH